MPFQVSSTIEGPTTLIANMEITVTIGPITILKLVTLIHLWLEQVWLEVLDLYLLGLHISQLVDFRALMATLPT